MNWLYAKCKAWDIVRVSKGTEMTENTLYEGGGRIISLEQITYIGEQQKIWSLAYGATQMAVNTDHLHPLRTKKLEGPEEEEQK